eukprot:3891249-Pyramimonas_sp.AAC.1
MFGAPHLELGAPPLAFLGKCQQVGDEALLIGECFEAFLASIPLGTADRLCRVRQGPMACSNWEPRYWVELNHSLPTASCFRDA